MEYLNRQNLKQQKVAFFKMVSIIRKELMTKGITFEEPKLVGSARRNLVLLGNEGYDLDYQLKLSKYPDKYTAKDIKQAFMIEFNHNAEAFGLADCEDSTNVIAIKKLENSCVAYSYDIEILDKNSIDKYVILRNDKIESQNDIENYHFIELSDAANFDIDYEKIKNADAWQTVKEKYKSKKEKDQSTTKDKRKPSISLLMEAVNETLNSKK